ncbi:MAG TPA: L,D-transpeptidase [Verrucomicrobiae bacterium]|jgi:lipoprotein-anchoring transpeptidase ErfK/SrfK|nr:L,D-transpeptidase [Verrucomicrobiae bacterium]
MSDGHETTRKRLGCLLALLTLGFAMGSQAQVTEAPIKDRIRRLVVVSIPDRKLAVLENGSVLATFPVAVGAAVSPSPTGEFQIVTRVSHPTYYRPGTVIPSGKDSPIGTRWLGLSQKGYGIHGTNAPRSIGRAASHGCIRLRNRDMERLYSMLHVGDIVQIHAERDEEVAQIFGSRTNENTIAAVQVTGLAAGQ